MSATPTQRHSAKPPTSKTCSRSDDPANLCPIWEMLLTHKHGSSVYPFGKWRFEARRSHADYSTRGPTTELKGTLCEWEARISSSRQICAATLFMWKSYHERK